MKRLISLFTLVCVVGSMNLLAQVYLGTIDFTGLEDHTDYNEYSDYGILSEVEGRPLYISKGTRQITITFDEIDQWQIYHTDDNISYLECKKNTWASLHINGLKEGDKVKITPKGNICLGNDISDFGTYTFFSVEKELTINTDGNLEVKTNSANNGIYKIEISGEEGDEYHYDPSVEGYDLYWVGRNAAYTYDDDPMIGAGFNLDTSNQEAILLAQLGDGTPISKRIAISKNSNGTTPWSLSHASSGDASQGLKNTDSNWHNISICNLKKDDRVRITFHNDDYDSEENVDHAKFGSVGYSTYNGCAAFQDTNNNGTQDEGEPSVEAGLNLAGVDNTYKDNVTYFYTITEDGHLDIAFDGNVRLCQVEIYNDHLAVMVDKDNGSHETGYTAYFNNTGELETKTHVIPGGLKVQMGNTVETQHGGVVASPDIPMTFVYDELHHKIPRNDDHSAGLFTSNNDLINNLPTMGTFHKFTPEVDGKMTVRFFTANINYLWPEKDGNYSDLNNTSNESPVHVRCPYYLIKVNPDGTIEETIETINSYGSREITWEKDVQAGYSYYLFGGWSSGANAGNYSQQQEYLKKSVYGCGIANLLDVTFIVDKVVRPLAKWIENAKTEDDDLAYVKGYKYVKVKKMSGNIESCEPYLDGTTLKIKNIVYKDGDVNKGGVVLIEITDDTENYDRTDPVFALTVAYDAAYHSDNQHAEAERGHTWDFSSNPLYGMEWTNYSGYSTETLFGTYYQDYFAGNKNVNTESLLYRESNWTDIHGTQHSDWTFGFRLQQSGNSYDPQLINHYDLAGDNADMMWDTEGVVMFASANLSSIFNEKIGAIDRTDKTQADPDRYIGLWPNSGDGVKSEFIIPHLDKDDRIIIWMGSGEGTGHEQMVFNITNARDAEYNEISATDNYVAGGSQWNSANSDPYYRGCYHFFAKEKGDMKFTLVDGYMCKIYKVQIYTGDRIETNEIKGATENDNKYLLWSRAHDPNEDTSETNKDYTEENRPNWTLKYFNKDQKLADGSNNVKNAIISKTGIITDSSIKTNTTANTFTYQHALGDIGTFRVRGKDMEKNMNYVADYADHNVTVAYQETQKYPYTWDFKDMTGFSDEALLAEDALEAAKPDGFTDDYWNSIKDTYYEITSNDLSLWEIDSENGAYWLRLNSQSKNPKAKDNIFQTAKSIDGNQVWANGAVVPETQGLWFYTENNVQASGGKCIITDEGMQLNGNSGWPYTLVVPNVPKNAAVYLRMKNSVNNPYFAYSFKGDGGSEVYPSDGKPMLVPGTESEENEVKYAEYIFAIKNNGDTKRHLVLSFGGYELKKLAVSKDPKAVNIKGYASESRDHTIDPTLTGYLTGSEVSSYLVTNANYTDRTLTLTEANKPIPYDEENSKAVGYIIQNKTKDDNDKYTLSILNGGFHLFVPDMHDTETMDCTTSMMTPQLEETSLTSYDGDYVNYVLSYKYYNLNGNDDPVGSQIIGEEKFYRVSSKGIKLRDNSAYLKLLKENVKPSPTNPNGAAQFTFIFEDIDDEEDTGVVTGIQDMQAVPDYDNAVWYNVNGQKLDGRPTKSGIYIMNGHKMYIK